jgi:arabinan endo-1,5-alpha-L-arabinosidase
MLVKDNMPMGNNAFQTPLPIDLRSRDNLTCKFQIQISTEATEGCSCLIYVTGYHLAQNSETTVSYLLPDREHHSYLDFYERLSNDFGLRLPQNRKHQLPNTNTVYPFSIVLTENIDDRIRYGYGDPAVLKATVGGQVIYYLVVTSNDAPNSFPILKSTNLTDWTLQSFVFPEGKKPEWALDGEHISDYWAPEMHLIGNEYRIYFVARHKENLDLCIGMASSERPEGPYTAHTEPVVDGNIIDPHIFVDQQGISYLYWKEDNNDVWPGHLIDLLYHHPELTDVLFDKKEDRITAAFIQTLWPWIKNLPPMERFLALQVLIEVVISNFNTFYKHLSSLIERQPLEIQEKIKIVLKYMKTPMYVQQLSADGTQVQGERIKVIENDLDWEAHLVEGMWVTQQDENFYLFYAGNDFSTDQYGIGVAVAKSPTGPYTKMQQPFLKSTREWWAPGHPSVVLDNEENPRLFLHAFPPGRAGYKEFRALLSVPIRFSHGTVVVAKIN